MSNATQIARVRGRRVWDSRGRPTVEAQVMLHAGARGRAIAPAGASRGSGEALDRRNGGAAFGGYGVRAAVAAVNDEIGPGLQGLDATDQGTVDRRLIELDGTPDKSRLGANATIAVSMATAHAAAAAAGEPLWRYLRPEHAALPLPEIQIFGGGAHAARRVDIQDFMVVCPGASSFAQALDWTAEVYRAAGALMAEAGRLRGVADEGGYWPDFTTNEEALETLLRAIERAGLRPGEQVAISIDIAASEFGQSGVYRLGLDGRELDTGGLIDLLLGWLERYPVLSIEDPLAEDDPEGFVAFTRAAGERCQVVADDLTVTDAARVRAAAKAKAANALLIKPNQRGTLSETKAAWDAARAAGWGGIVSARSGETEDTTIVHLAIGWGVPQLKVGSFARSERMAKWNEALRVEEALGANARLARPFLPRPTVLDCLSAEAYWIPLRDLERRRGMAKAIHMMVRVLEEERSVAFYDQAFGLKIADRYDFDDFTLVYLRNADNDFEIELTVNKGRSEPYQHGDGYGHVAFAVEDLDAEHNRFQELGLQPADIKEFHRDGLLMARFFFVQDPDGYKIEVLQRHGRYQ